MAKSKWVLNFFKYLFLIITITDFISKKTLCFQKSLLLRKFQLTYFHTESIHKGILPQRDVQWHFYALSVTVTLCAICIRVIQNDGNISNIQFSNHSNSIEQNWYSNFQINNMNGIGHPMSLLGIVQVIPFFRLLNKVHFQLLEAQQTDAWGWTCASAKFGAQQNGMTCAVHAWKLLRFAGWQDGSTFHWLWWACGKLMSKICNIWE